MGLCLVYALFLLYADTLNLNFVKNNFDCVKMDKETTKAIVKLCYKICPNNQIFKLKDKDINWYLDCYSLSLPHPEIIPLHEWDYVPFRMVTL